MLKCTAFSVSFKMPITFFLSVYVISTSLIIYKSLEFFKYLSQRSRKPRYEIGSQRTAERLRRFIMATLQTYVQLLNPLYFVPQIQHYAWCYKSLQSSFLKKHFFLSKTSRSQSRKLSITYAGGLFGSIAYIHPVQVPWLASNFPTGIKAKFKDLSGKI